MDEQVIPSMIRALGGAENVVSVDLFPHRVRVRVTNQGLVSEDGLRQAPVLALLRAGNSVQIIAGQHAHDLARTLSTTLGLPSSDDTTGEN